MPPTSIFSATARIGRWRRSGCTGLILAALASGASGQEVITGDYQWHYDQGENAALPAWQKFPQIKYPARLSDGQDIHYVVILQHTGVRGERNTRAMLGDTGAPREVVMNASNQMRLKSPAKRDGEPIEADVWFSVIFNPAAPRAALGDFPARLLQVRPVPIPFVRGKQKIPRARARLLVTPEARAEIVALEGDDLTEEARRSLEETVYHWKFSPAKEAGRPVFSEVTLPVAFLPIEPAGERDYLPPRLIKPVRPALSFWKKISRPQGEVRVQFIVDKTGAVNGAAVVHSTNPELDDASLAAVRQWVFQPATRNGRAVQTTLTVPVRFGNGGGGNQEGFFDNPEEKPPETAAAFDHAPRLRTALRIVYPYYLAAQGAAGRARVQILVGADGRVRESHIEQATAIEFGRALQAALDTAVFTPATRGEPGQPVDAVLHITRDFNLAAKPGAGPVTLSAADQELLARDTGRAPGDKADGFSLVPGKMPALARMVKSAGWVETAFWVDRAGEVHLPRITSHSNELLAYAAMQELAGRPLAARAEPALLRARIDFPAPEPRAK